MRKLFIFEMFTPQKTLHYAPSIWNNPEAYQAHQQHGSHAWNESNRYDQNAHLQSVLQRCGGSQGGVYAAVWFWLQESLLLAERFHVQGVRLEKAHTTASHRQTVKET